ncbi:NUDIX domain-containing protein [Jatrophihabitans sp.]|jgi:ADP-ribose pyrophosphatase|uniref:NUDIX domain-containing protein n=1 Tax=Jatrophihabitans sp. TaxID=1932789 RepID=UPI002EDF6463
MTADRHHFEVLSSEPRFSGAVFEVRTDAVRMPDGSVANRDVVIHPGAVAVLALDSDGNVVMVRQYRHAVGHELLELPAGLLDVEGEPALTGARRELFEEAALAAGDWAVLLDMYNSSGMSDEAIRVYLARDLTEFDEQDRFAPEHEEISMTVERYPLEELVRMALAGELVNATAVAGVLAAWAARADAWAGLRPAGAPWPARPDRAGPAE